MRVPALADLRVLCSPAGYYMDGGFAGSEPLWAHQIVAGLAPRVREIVAITGDLSHAHLPANVTPLVLGGMKDADVLAASVAARYMLRYGVAGARRLLRGDVDLVHHVLPFGLGQTYNLAAPVLGRRPFVIGPVQGRAYVKHVERIALHGAAQTSRSGVPLANRLANAAGPILAQLNAAMLRRADVVVAISDEAARAVEAESGVRPRVIPPGVDTGAFERRPPHTGERIELLTVGYLLKRKRVDVVLRALRRLLDRGIDARLTIAGDGPEAGALHALEAELGIGARVRWLGFIPNREMPPHYRDADVFVSASEHEGLATVFLEAFASGLPLVCTTNPGSRAVITNELRGRIVEQEDHVALGDAVAEVFGDRERCENRSVAIRTETVGVYDWGAVCGGYAAAYETALERAAGRGWSATPSRERSR